MKQKNNSSILKKMENPLLNPLKGKTILCCGHVNVYCFMNYAASGKPSGYNCSFSALTILDRALTR